MYGYCEPYNRASMTNDVRITLLGRYETVKTIVTQDMTVVVGVVASNRRWGFSIPYRSIYNSPALVRLTIISLGLSNLRNVSHNPYERV